MCLPGYRVALGGGAQAYFSTRADGDLRRSGGELADRLGLRELHTLRQVHSAQVRMPAFAPRAGRSAEQGGAHEEDARGDALITDRPLSGVAVFGADCLPIALAGRRAIGAVHAGWRGLAEGVIEAAVSRLRALGEEGDLHAMIGPGAGGCCYEVGAEVQRALGLEAPRGPVDLAAIARERALAVGVTRVRVLDCCTICDRRFFSYRREGARAGRQGVIVWIDRR